MIECGNFIHQVLIGCFLHLFIMDNFLNLTRIEMHLFFNVIFILFINFLSNANLKSKHTPI